MKVMLVNGSPHEKGCTYTALAEIASALKENEVGSDFFWLGTGPLYGCASCGKCRETGRCVFNDKVNEFIDIIEKYDGFVFGSPVHYASSGGLLSAFLDRVFYAAADKFYLKPGAAIVSARRAGTTASLDRLNKYFTISQMPVISSCYWNMVHGATGDDVKRDEEGLQIMRTLGRNMAWFLKCVEAGKKAGVPLPKKEQRIWTNFIR